MIFSTFNALNHQILNFQTNCMLVVVWFANAYYFPSKHSSLESSNLDDEELIQKAKAPFSGTCCFKNGRTFHLIGIFCLLEVKSEADLRRGCGLNLFKFIF